MRIILNRNNSFLTSKEFYIMPAKYAPGVIAEQLGISKTALQHYIHILEEHGYEVSRNSRMHRQFSDNDLMILRAFLTLCKKEGYKLKDAAATVLQPNFNFPNEVQTIHSSQIMPSDVHLARFEDISNSMELMASHIYGIEQQNTQLLTLIEEQRTQNELLLEQNQTLKQQLGAMMQHIMEQTNTPSSNQRQLDRVEQQNNAIMNALNRLNVSQFEAKQEAVQDLPNSGSQEKGFFSKLFK